MIAHLSRVEISVFVLQIHIFLVIISVNLVIDILVRHDYDEQVLVILDVLHEPMWILHEADVWNVVYEVVELSIINLHHELVLVILVLIDQVLVITNIQVQVHRLLLVRGSVVVVTIYLELINVYHVHDDIILLVVHELNKEISVKLIVQRELMWQRLVEIVNHVRRDIL